MGMRIMENMKKGQCEVCGWRPPPLYPKIAHKLLNAHHVVHRSRGGSTEADNLVTLCPNHHAIAHALTGRGTATATSFLPSQVTSKVLIVILREIDADPEGWIQNRNHQYVSKMVRKQKSLVENAPPKGADTSPEGYVALFSKLTDRRHMKGRVNPENLPEQLTEHDLAILLNLDLADVIEMARRGILNGYKKGKVWRFWRKNVEQYFPGQRETE